MLNLTPKFIDDPLSDSVGEDLDDLKRMRMRRWQWWR